MRKRKIFEEIINIVRPFTKDKSLLEKVNMEMKLIYDLKINSVNIIDIIIQCEDVFGILIEDDDDRIDSIGDAVKWVSGRMSC
jgi:acyl carrier protein